MAKLHLCILIIYPRGYLKLDDTTPIYSRGYLKLGMFIVRTEGVEAAFESLPAHIAPRAREIRCYVNADVHVNQLNILTMSNLHAIQTVVINVCT